MRASLQRVFPDAAIYHIGSTSVRGLSSKDTVDIAVAVPDLLATITPKRLHDLSGLGFQYVPASFADDSDHAFFHHIENDHRMEHLHVMQNESEALRSHLLFRDYLRSHPGAAARYEESKQTLAQRFAEDRDRYVDEKMSIVTELLTEAELWFSAK